MKWDGIWSSVGRVFNTKLFDIHGTAVTLATIVTVVLILIATVVISRLLRRGTARAFSKRGVRDEGTVATVNGLMHYVILLVGVGVALQTVGINLSALFAAGAVFAVGLGFAMQNIVQNFVAGVILLAERSIKPGDVLEVGERVVKVVEMRIRATIVRTRDGEHLIVPNSVLVQSLVKNYTFKDASYRVRARVGVVYGSDMDLVRETLAEVARDVEWRLKDREPMILLTDFGDSSVNFEVSVWMSDPWMSRPALSLLNKAIWDALKQRSIVIAFPQLDVHLDQPVVESLRGLAAGN